MKALGEAKYKKIKTLKKNGTAIRTYTVKGLKDGKYYFKVKAYNKSEGTTVYGSYSKAKASVPVEKAEKKTVKKEAVTEKKAAKTDKKVAAKEAKEDKKDTQVAKETIKTDQKLKTEKKAEKA